MKWFVAIFLSVSFVFLACFGVSCAYGYFFPMKYNAEIASACGKFDVEKAVVYAIINVESRFRKNTISNKGAVGLMQIMPTTAEDLAGRLGMEEFDLFDPSDNIVLGTYYIKILAERFENLRTALCAYNAGPTNVTAWLEKNEYSDDQKTLKKIPFKETRDYILKFERNFRYYKTKE